MIRPITLALAVTAAASGPRVVAAQHDMSHDMSRTERTLPALSLARAGSGTAWLPDSSRSPMLHAELGRWMLMLHGSAMGMFDRQWTLHGDSRWGVLDWEMGTAARDVGGGLLRFTAMTSFESFFLPDTGYPQLLQSGETFEARRIANAQHPHNLVGELSATYDHALADNTLSAFAYAAVVGEPALGPVAYQHRPSAAADPFAPLGAHWQDGSHLSTGVATVGLYNRIVRLEGSAFNARESDDRRGVDLSGARLDSYAGRITVEPTGRVAFSAWGGYLAHHDPLDPVAGMQRFGASVLTETRGIRGGALSTALVWGMNNHHHGARAHDHDGTVTPSHHLSSSVLIETTLGVGTRTELFVRGEQVQKTADDLGFLAGNLMETFNVRTLSLGGLRELASVRGASFAVGGRWALNLLPQTLHYVYTTTRPAGFAIFVKVLPR